MKFSYSLLKKIAPGITGKAALIERLNFHAFEAEDGPGDTLEIGIPANRYSDASHHMGVARIASAIFAKMKYNEPAFAKLKKTSAPKHVHVSLTAKKECSRYSGMYAEIKKVGESPKWMQDTILAVGMRPLNAIVDVMNYAMIEVGQPLHAFDADLIAGEIAVRMAKAGEKVETIDREEYELTPDDIVIADEKGVLAIAGVKGGSRAEVNEHTKRLIVESANFDPVCVYKTSRRLGLLTDAALRFSHGLTPALVEIGMRRAAQLLKDEAGATLGEWVDVGSYKEEKRALRFHRDRFHALTGLLLKESVAFEYLKKLGFAAKGSFIEVPPTRTDITIFEDLVEEIVNLYGYDALPATPPRIAMHPSGYEDVLTLKDEARGLLRGFGMSESYNYTFVSEKDLERYGSPAWWGAAELANPISIEFQYLRPSLVLGLITNALHNMKFHEEVRMSEIGKRFRIERGELAEELALGMMVAYQKGSPALELKGAAEQLLLKLGLTDVTMVPVKDDIKYLHNEEALRIESDHTVLGYVGTVRDLPNVAVAELNMDVLVRLVAEEKSYEPLSKYPAIVRDLSLYAPQEARIGEMLALIERAAPKYIEDVDMIDFYQPRAERLPNREQREITRDEDKTVDAIERKSVTFRIIFQSKERTLTDAEIDKEMARITAALQDEFDVEVR